MSSSQLRDVSTRNPDQILDMLIVDGVVCHLAALAVFHQTEVLQEAQLMGNRRVGHAEESGDVAYAQLLPRKRDDNFQARGIAQDLERLAQIERRTVVAERLSCGLHALFVDERHIAPRARILFQHIPITVEQSFNRNIRDRCEKVKASGGWMGSHVERRDRHNLQVTIIARRLKPAATTEAADGVHLGGGLHLFAASAPFSLPSSAWEHMAGPCLLARRSRAEPGNGTCYFASLLYFSLYFS